MIHRYYYTLFSLENQEFSPDFLLDKFPRKPYNKLNKKRKARDMKPIEEIILPESELEIMIAVWNAEEALHRPVYSREINN